MAELILHDFPGFFYVLIYIESFPCGDSLWREQTDVWDVKITSEGVSKTATDSQFYTCIEYPEQGPHHGVLIPRFIRKADDCWKGTVLG